MFMRIDLFEAALNEPKKADPNAALILQELLGGKKYARCHLWQRDVTFGKYICQSINFRSKSKIWHLYGFAASIFAEEPGNVDVVNNGVAKLNKGHGGSGGYEGDEGENFCALFEDMKHISLGAASSPAEAARRP